MDDLEKAVWLVRRYQVPGVGPTQDGRNAGGDRYFTDGMMVIGVLKPLPAETSDFIGPVIFEQPIVKRLRHDRGGGKITILILSAYSGGPIGGPSAFA